MVAESIINVVKDYLRQLRQEGVPVCFGVLFGSQVTGDIHAESDIDLVVVSPLFDTNRTHETVGQLWCIASCIDAPIEPIACGERQWLEDDVTPILEVARMEGMIIMPAQPAASPTAPLHG